MYTPTQLLRSYPPQNNAPTARLRAHNTENDEREKDCMPSRSHTKQFYRILLVVLVYLNSAEMDLWLWMLEMHWASRGPTVSCLILPVSC
jgi:hypothetical protein